MRWQLQLLADNTGQWAEKLIKGAILAVSACTHVGKRVSTHVTVSFFVSNVHPHWLTSELTCTCTIEDVAALKACW